MSSDETWGKGSGFRVLEVVCNLRLGEGGGLICMHPEPGGEGGFASFAVLPCNVRAQWSSIQVLNGVRKKTTDTQTSIYRDTYPMLSISTAVES